MVAGFVRFLLKHNIYPQFLIMIRFCLETEKNKVLRDVRVSERTQNETKKKWALEWVSRVKQNSPDWPITPSPMFEAICWFVILGAATTT